MSAERGRRERFNISTLDRRAPTLGHGDTTLGPRVTRYRLSLGVLDEVGVAALERALEGAQCVIIDELGKMELFSERFREPVKETVHSDKHGIGSGMTGRNPCIDELKALP
jgi:nucleoside-triphosphatase